MPVVTGFKRVETTRRSLQPTRVIATYNVIPEIERDPIFQITTGGSEHRKYPGKGSQTTQFTRETAEQLWRLLGQTYGFK